RQYVKSNKIFVANNTLDTDKEFNYLKQFEKNGITKIKKELGINYSLTLGFIGRLTKRKELDYLLDVFQALNKEFKNTGLYIIGKGSEYDDIANKIKNDKINNAYLIGPKYNYEAAKFLYAIDIIIIPWAVGLTVNHALIYGTPVISQCKDGEFIGHGPEVIHIKHKFNGWIAEYNNKQDMIQGIHEIINNYNFYSQNAAKYARENLTIDIMIQGFTEAYEYVKNK
ncbi:MAG: glycosyltransferase, partial [Candidatus Woesearchaeota archaeon]